MNSELNSWNADAPRIFCISPHFAPMRDSEAFCSAKFINALAESGAQITVIVYAKPATEIDRSEMWNSVAASVIRIPPVAQKNRFASLATALRYQTWLYARWMDEAVQQAKRLHRDSPFDVVYSRSLPMFGQIAGYWCAKELDVPWIANLNDPWDFHQFPVGVSKEDLTTDSALSDFWMRRTLRSADLVTYPSQRLRDYQTNLSTISHRSQIIPHVGNAPALQESPVNGNSSNFRLVHAGKLGSNELTGRSTAALLDGLSLFLNGCVEARNQLRLTLVGAEDPVTQARVHQLGLEGIVEPVGLIDYQDSLKYIQSATACLLVEGGMSEGIFLPSKLVDYISARKPILALSPRVGVVADLASGGGITRVDAGDAHGIRDAIRGLYEDFRSGTLALRSPSGAQVDQFRSDLVANRFLGALRQLITEKKESKLQRA